MHIGLIAIDLDGTLLNDTKQVSPETLQAVSEATAQGIHVVIASARPPRSVRAIYQQLQLGTWQINYNGAMIWDEPNRQVLFHEPMDGQTVLRLIHRSRELHSDLVVQCEIIDRWHTDRDDKRFTTGTGRLFEPDILAAVETICREPITTLNLLGEPAAIDRIEPVLIDEFGGQIKLVRAGDHDLLIGHHRDACKSHALQQVAAHYGVPMADVMAIGDAPNDVGMLQLAGIGVAMDNAHPRVKDVADWIAPSNNDHGVSAAIRQFALIGS